MVELLAKGLNYKQKGLFKIMMIELLAKGLNYKQKG